MRLIGINAPWSWRTTVSTTEPFAEAAKQRLQALVSASDGRLALQPGRQARDDHTGGPWRTCSMPAAPASRRRLLGEGLGYLVAVAPNTELTACQQAAERAARSANLGVWKRSPVLSARSTGAERLRRGPRAGARGRTQPGRYLAGDGRSAGPADRAEGAQGVRCETGDADGGTFAGSAWLGGRSFPPWRWCRSARRAGRCR
ncbi:thermonuclease family protein [Pseudomonas aeruginosa]